MLTGLREKMMSLPFGRSSNPQSSPERLMSGSQPASPIARRADLGAIADSAIALRQPKKLRVLPAV
jgi:hypothetical protein